MTGEPTHDAIIVGAGIGGTIAAMLLGGSGLRVLLLESRRTVDSYKTSCSHLIQPGAIPTLAGLGLDRDILDAGGVSTPLMVWTPHGTLYSAATDTPGLNLRRSVLDPLLRTRAAATSGVELVNAATVHTVTRDGGGTRVHWRDGSGARGSASGRLVVGADGRHSAVARACGHRTRRIRHDHFGWMAQYTGIHHSPESPLSRVYFLDPGEAYIFPTDAGHSILSVVRPGVDRSTLQHDLDGEMMRTLTALPGHPDLSHAVRVNRFHQNTEYSSYVRIPVRGNVALVGDAAMTPHYLWGVGIGMAVVGAHLLADCVTSALLHRRSLRIPLMNYMIGLVKRFGIHQMVMTDYATGRNHTTIERRMYAAADRDPLIARCVFDIGSQRATPTSLLRPSVIAGMIAAGRPAADARTHHTSIPGGRP